MQLMKYDQFKTIAIIAEGVPEKRARQLLWEAEKKKILIIGPATVGKENNESKLIFGIIRLMPFSSLPKVESSLDVSRLVTRAV